LATWVAIFIGGPVHDSEHQAGKDMSAQAKLEDEAGWMVLRFHHQDGRTTACGDKPREGAGRSTFSGGQALAQVADQVGFGPCRLGGQHRRHRLLDQALRLQAC